MDRRNACHYKFKSVVKLQARKNDENEIKFLQTDFSEFACLYARCIMCIE